MLNNKSIPSDVKSYYEFCTFFSLHQLIKVLTRITCNSATIIDHILASYSERERERKRERERERVAQQRIIDVGLSDHQFIFCTRKISRINIGTHKHVKFRSFRHYSPDPFKESLTSINFPNYLNFNDPTEAYDAIIQKIMVSID